MNSSWRRAAALAAAAFLLRAGCAILTESHPLFPSYYYTDARLTDARARALLADLAAGGPGVMDGTLSERLQILQAAAIYRALSPRPLFVKLTEAALGALATAAFFAACLTVFSEQAAFLAAGAAAVWPSAVFFTSQDLKEAPTLFLLYAGLAGLLWAAFRPGSARRGAVFGAIGALCLLAAGFYRSYFLILFSLVCAAGATWEAARSRRRRPLLAAAAAVAALAIFPWTSRRLFARLSAVRAVPPAAAHPVLHPTAPLPPLSPAGLSAFRRERQQDALDWARAQMGRSIDSLIYPRVEFRTWSDAAAFLPRGAFAAMFQPFPGLYPLGGKRGRILAAIENAFLCAAFLLAAFGAARGPWSAGRGVFLVLFLAMAAGAAFLEPDLGAASRHKLVYLPLFFPFAAEAALRLQD